MILKTGTWQQAGRHGAGAAAKSSHLIQSRRQRKLIGNGVAF